MKNYGKMKMGPVDVPGLGRTWVLMTADGEEFQRVVPGPEDGWLYIAVDDEGAIRCVAAHPGQVPLEKLDIWRIECPDAPTDVITKHWDGEKIT